jgi:protein-tyrosine phosphatase
VIDIHSHILPGIDDGAQTMEESVELIQLARATGTTTIVASPHSDSQYTYDPRRVDELIAEAQERVGDGIRIVRGCDFHLMTENIQNALREPRTYTINRGPYVLMELSDMLIFPNTSRIWDELEAAGMCIILTHPERNLILQDHIDKIKRWVDEGRYMQVTAQSLLGQFGKRAQKVALHLLDHGLCHFIASDGHNVQGRPPRLDIASQWIAEHYAPELAELLVEDNPRAAVAGDTVDIAVPRFRRRGQGLLGRLIGR